MIRALLIVAVVSSLSGCVHLGAGAASLLLGGGGGWLATVYAVEKDADMSIRLGEDVACIIKAKNITHGERVSTLTNELCAAMILEQSGGVM